MFIHIHQLKSIILCGFIQAQTPGFDILTIYPTKDVLDQAFNDTKLNIFKNFKKDGRSEKYAKTGTWRFVQEIVWFNHLTYFLGTLFIGLSICLAFTDLQNDPVQFDIQFL